jgi:hypothetical protein
MSTREYKMAADPIEFRGGQMREIKEFTDGMPPRVILVVPNDMLTVDIVGALRRAYQDGREDRSEELLG